MTRRAPRLPAPSRCVAAALHRSFSHPRPAQPARACCHVVLPRRVGGTHLPGVGLLFALLTRRPPLTSIPCVRRPRYKCPTPRGLTTRMRTAAAESISTPRTASTPETGKQVDPPVRLCPVWSIASRSLTSHPPAQTTGRPLGAREQFAKVAIEMGRVRSSGRLAHERRWLAGKEED